MPIARVMNMPDGSTPPVPIGGGDVNGTLNTALWAHAGTAASGIAQPRHLKIQSSSLGVPSVATALAGEGEGQPVAVEEGAVAEEGIEAPAPPPPRRTAPQTARRG